MKVAIDCRALRNPPSGISNYLVTTINSLSVCQPDWQFILLTNQEFHPAHQKNLLKAKNVRILQCPLAFYKNVAILWLLIKVPRIIKKLNPDIYWSPAFLLPPGLPSELKTLVTVHDVVSKQFKHTMSWVGRIYAKFLLNYSINRADLLWVNSKYTQSEILKYYPNKNQTRIFAGFFINNDFYKPIEILPDEKRRILTKYNLTGKFLLFVGTLEPRKNLLFLINLMPELSKHGFKLLIVGPKGWGNTGVNGSSANKVPIHESIRFAGFIDFEELRLLYNLATVYVSTSLNEGFGMPQLEAMACGCPVVSPHNSAMIEVVAGAGETVNTWEPADWINKINRVADNRAYYQKSGFARVQEYNKEKVICNLVNFIQRTSQT